jgi:RHS repeat-associated protein
LAPPFFLLWQKKGGNSNYLYNSNEWQTATKQYDFNARFYDPVIARFAQVDPLADLFGQQSVSSYAAFWNSPVNFQDKWGLVPEDGEPSLWKRARNWVRSVIGVKNDKRSETKNKGGLPESFDDDFIDFLNKYYDYNNISAHYILDPVKVYGQKPKDGTENNLNNVLYPGNGSMASENNWIHWLGPGMIVAGIDIIPKNSAIVRVLYGHSFKQGAHRNTSIASATLRKVLPNRVTSKFGLWAAGQFGTKTIGGIAARAIPVFGWGITIFDATYNGSFWLSDRIIEALPYSEEVKRNQNRGWMAEAGVCFKSGTLVYYKDGLLEIENLNIGDSVFS